ncbi:hypothetical protein ACF0H5_021975 [Mactra antiquata]
MSSLPEIQPKVLPGGFIQVPQIAIPSYILPQATKLPLYPQYTSFATAAAAKKKSKRKRKYKDNDSDATPPKYKAPHTFLIHDHGLIRLGDSEQPKKTEQQSASEQPNTSNEGDSTWIHSGLLKRHRTQITNETRKQILEFCRYHQMLKQGDVAEIFGIDRTTVTKLLKKGQEQGESSIELSIEERAQYELEDFLYKWMISTVKKYNHMKPVWSCEAICEQAVELQNVSDWSDWNSNFIPTLDWVYDYIKRFRLQRFIKDYPGDRPERPNNGPKREKKPPSHRIPKENMAEYTIVETPLDSMNINLAALEPKQEPKEEVVQELDRETVMDREIKSLEKFREQQKAMEEANKQKKLLLSKTITERKQKAKKEAHKLEHIQKELFRLDNLLTADVQVIRGKIEETSRDYMEAQKRFERAENEYVAAKMDLHNKSELKEQLTEHLYTIIHQNEVRKAKKLADLMKELEMENGENEDLELPQLPPLTTFQPQQMIVSPTGSKSPPGLTKFKLVDDGPDNPSKVVSNDSKNSDIVIQPKTDGTAGETVFKKTSESSGCDNLNDSDSETNIKSKDLSKQKLDSEADDVNVTSDSEKAQGSNVTTDSNSVCESPSTRSSSTPTKVAEQNNQSVVDSDPKPSTQTEENSKVPSKWDFDSSSL